MRLDVEASEEDLVLLRPQTHDSKARSKGSTFLFCDFCVFAKNVCTFFWFLFFFHRRVFLLLFFAFVLFHVFFVVFHFPLFIWPKGLGRLFDSATDPLVSA